jgi:uncharacterized cofD-like protein
MTVGRRGDGRAGGPRVVALGGGHGCAAALRAVRRYAGQVTAVVSVADDGGSTGRLRELLDVVALGDLRKCLVALAEPGSPLARAFEHRFEEGELAGHALGNLVLAGLVGVTGSPVAGVDAAGELLKTSGRVLPATTEPVVLKADAARGEVAGQVAVSRSGRIRRVSLVPADAVAPAEAVAAIEQADQVVIGPGSVYTSVLAAVAAAGITEALGRTRAQRVYVCNLRPQIPETEGFDVAAHVAALRAHGVALDVVLCDTSRGLGLGDVDGPVIDADLAGHNGLVHDPAKLAGVLRDLLA